MKSEVHIFEANGYRIEVWLASTGKLVPEYRDCEDDEPSGFSDIIIISTNISYDRPESSPAFIYGLIPNNTSERRNHVEFNGHNSKFNRHAAAYAVRAWVITLERDAKTALESGWLNTPPDSLLKYMAHASSYYQAASRTYHIAYQTTDPVVREPDPDTPDDPF